MLQLGEITLGANNAYIALLWLVAGLLCTLLSDRNGVWVATGVAFLFAVLPVIVFVGVPRADEPLFEFFRHGGQVDRYFDEALIPLFAAVIGALVGELIMPSEYEE
jgi:bacteriorhodopsin